MIQRPNQFVRTVVDGQKLLDTFGNCFPVVSQRPSKANPEKGLEAGTRFTLQIIMDKSPVIKDKETGMPLDDNRLNTFEVTVPGCAYPAPNLPFSMMAKPKIMVSISTRTEDKSSSESP